MEGMFDVKDLVCVGYCALIYLLGNYCRGVCENGVGSIIIV